MTQQLCPACGTLASEEATSCAKCGSSLALAASRPVLDATSAMAAHETPTVQYRHGESAAAPAQSSASLLAAQRIMDQLKAATIGEYEILSELGRGGMATVYLAHDLSLDRKVAIKVMSPALLIGDGAAERFKREAKTAGNLSHPHIIPIHAVKESGELLYFVMKFVEGRALDSVVKEQGPLPIPMVVQILTEVASALAHAHRKGVVHRDVKPANVMLDGDGWAVVTDFGIAKVTEQRGLTMTGATVGTPAYMSPEQCSGRDVTGKSDQYSMGILGYELLTGRVPFTSDSLMGIFMAHMSDAPPPLSQARPDCPASLGAIIERMIAKEPGDRFPSLEEASAALSALMKPDAREQTRTSIQALARTSGDRPRISVPVSPVPINRAATMATKTERRFPAWGYAAIAAPVLAVTVLVLQNQLATRGTVSDSATPGAFTDSAKVTNPTASVGASTDVATGQQSPSRPDAKAVPAPNETRPATSSAQTPPPQRTVAAALANTKAAADSAASRTQPQGAPITVVPTTPTPSAPVVDSGSTKVAPAPLDAPRFTTISAGGSTTCGALADDAGVVCWGAPAPGGEMVRGLLFEKIAVGDGHICGLTPAGEAYCWGSNSNGQLGDGSTTERPGPTAVRATQRFSEISVGAGHTCALSADGAAFCWGGNRFGQLGDGSRSNRNRPVPVRSTAGNQGFQSLAAGGSHTCGITRGNKAFCWGDGFSGQVGNSMLDFAQEPFAVKTDLAFRTVVTGERHTCGLTTTGRAYCWGDNKNGQLGNDTRDDRSVPDSVNTEQIFTSVAAGGSHSCGLTNRRQLLCWGQNSDGRLGDGTRNLRALPVTAAGGQSFARVSAGSGHTCAITLAGNAMCWGGNARGQLGSGSATNYSATPILVKINGS